MLKDRNIFGTSMQNCTFTNIIEVSKYSSVFISLIYLPRIIQSLDTLRYKAWWNWDKIYRWFSLKYHWCHNIYGSQIKGSLRDQSLYHKSQNSNKVSSLVSVYSNDSLHILVVIIYVILLVREDEWLEMQM